MDCSERRAEAGEGGGKGWGGHMTGGRWGKLRRLVAAAVAVFTPTCGYNSGKSIQSQYASGDGEWIY